jgi:glycogen operon protein
MVNAYWDELDFEIPPADDHHQPWRRCIDTFRGAPDDVCRWDQAPVTALPTYRLAPQSLVLLVAPAREHAAVCNPTGGKPR